MTEVFKAVDYDTRLGIEVHDPEPLASAVLFKELSDKVWEQKPETLRLACHQVPSTISAFEVRDQVNKIVDKVDERFVISGIGKVLDLGSFHGEDDSVVVDAETMDNPIGSSLQTFNWDNRCTYRLIDTGDKKVIAEFKDGHTDYYRELGIRLGLGRKAIATYSMQRMQQDQDETTNLSLVVSHWDFAETGYEGHHLVSAAIDEKQETELLGVMQQMIG